MSRSVRSLFVMGVVSITLVLGSCSAAQNLVDEALSAALRSAASQALKQAAQDKGQPLQGDPQCSGGVKTATKSADLACSATTQAGLPVTANVVITNAGDANCKGTMTIVIGSEKPFTQDFTNCGA